MPQTTHEESSIWRIGAIAFSALRCVSVIVWYALASIGRMPSEPPALSRLP